MKFLSQVELDPLDQMSPDVPERRHVRIDQNGTVEIFRDRYGKSIKFSLADNQSMGILVNVFDAPALYAQMLMDKLDRRLVLLERNLNDFECLPKKKKTNGMFR